MQRIANLDWATDVDFAFFLRDKKTDFHKHIADWGTRKPVLRPLWNLNSTPPPPFPLSSLFAQQCEHFW